ncbi:hypothetical protein DFP72DRAFT_1134286 [Ephemerocybe angulata]|uniref:Uncharacterized protein n=1 Tax=Ephemerocybe angulata TaxID=980116 RepID=A0A8H6HT89_9AGAR|nr:hypothetical protein DFP72DRAFT_1134286 [Tulosesus angulatus]
MHLNIITLLPLFIALASSVNGYYADEFDARDYLDELSTREVNRELLRREIIAELADFSSRDLLDAISMKLERRAGKKRAGVKGNSNSHENRVIDPEKKNPVHKPSCPICNTEFKTQEECTSWSTQEWRRRREASPLMVPTTSEPYGTVIAATDSPALRVVFTPRLTISLALHVKEIARRKGVIFSGTKGPGQMTPVARDRRRVAVTKFSRKESAVQSNMPDTVKHTQILSEFGPAKSNTEPSAPLKLTQNVSRNVVDVVCAFEFEETGQDCQVGGCAEG